MTIMRIRDIQIGFGDKTVLHNINFDIKNGDRIGLVGNNGAGKTTLAQIVYGKLQPDTGTIDYVSKSQKIGYLLQSTEYTVTDFHHALQNNLEGELLQHTSELGLSKVQDWSEERIHHLSGGEKLKLALANIWSSKPDVLILDEPTNHLDYKGMDWLVSELKSFEGAVVIISHDRYFLDRTVTQIVEIEDGKSKVFTGDYSAYRKEKERLYENQVHQYFVQQKYKEKIENQMDNLRNWSDKAHRESTKHGSPSERKQMGFKEYYRVKAKKMDIQVKSKMKRLEKELEKNKIEKPKEEAKVHFQFDDDGKRGKRMLEAKNISKQFNDRLLFSNSHFYLKHGERVGVLGENGCGKTTLIKIMLEHVKVSEGELWKSESLKIGYLSQDVTDLKDEQTPLKLLGLTDRDKLSRARTIFANIGLNEDKINKPIATLSLGERTRVKLVCMLLQDVDLLILDEPTNHLDLASRESLEKTLEDFEGAIIVVSHDFYFMKNLCDKLLVFEDKKVRRVEKSLTEYMEWKDIVKAKKDQKEELLVLQNEITALIGKLCMLTKEDPTYQEIDYELAELMKRKRDLTIAN